MGKTGNVAGREAKIGLQSHLQPDFDVLRLLVNLRADRAGHDRGQIRHARLAVLDQDVGE